MGKKKGSVPDSRIGVFVFLWSARGNCTTLPPPATSPFLPSSLRLPPTLVLLLCFPVLFRTCVPRVTIVGGLSAYICPWGHGGGGDGDGDGAVQVSVDVKSGR